MDVNYNQPTINFLNKYIEQSERELALMETSINTIEINNNTNKINLRILKRQRALTETQQEWNTLDSQVNYLNGIIQSNNSSLDFNKKSINTIKNNIIKFEKQIKDLQIEQQRRPRPLLPPVQTLPPPRPPRYLTREEREQELGRPSTAEPIFIMNSPGQGSSTDPLPPPPQPTLLTLPTTPQPPRGSPGQGSSNDPLGAFIYDEEDEDPVWGSGLDLEKAKLYALSDSDIEDLLGKDIFICVYPYLNEVEHIDDVFDSKGRCMLLFNTINEDAGHWVCMTKKKDRIDFFDPYGLKPDEPMKWLTEEKRDELDMETKRLTQLLRQSGYKVYYNNFEFQNEKKSNTCGRWCAVRLLYQSYSLDEFYKFIIHYKNKYELENIEDVVIYLTYEIINK